jgi:carbamoyltransferase
MRTNIDYLVLGPYLLDKTTQPAWMEGDAWRTQFQLD